MVFWLYCEVPNQLCRL
ncbi:hypothetical protein Patl1_17277 [Pistacia atlantica]|uniref:Uncharacterized protein n=1 Tax=Pistacia atlantica TaxID=434234 RepID=A0ACC1BBE3_9ROSI|nr:hypothetical protein Patl1_17277 [Pistacia atlantica]